MLDLTGLKQLKHLTLSGLPVQDHDLAFLAHLSSLEALRIQPVSSLGGTCLRHLHGLANLKHLWINELSHCTSEDLASLNGLPTLVNLTLIGEITDPALASLDDLPHLCLLWVYTSEPIQEGTIARLRRRLPALENSEFYGPIGEPPRATSPRQNRSYSAGRHRNARRPRSWRRR